MVYRNRHFEFSYTGPNIATAAPKIKSHRLALHQISAYTSYKQNLLALFAKSCLNYSVHSEEITFGPFANKTIKTIHTFDKVKIIELNDRFVCVCVFFLK